MASKLLRLVQDQNLNVHSDGASVAGKGAFKSTKKGGLAGRKPLGDLSNRGKPDFTKATRKPALNNFPEIIADASNRKGISKTSGKVKTRSIRKPLNDVSNYTVKPRLQKTSIVVSEASSCEYENEGFLHDHSLCIKARREASEMEQMDIFWMINGPTPSKNLSSPPKPSQLTEVEESAAEYLKEIPEDQYTLLPITRDSVSSPPCSPLPSPDRYTNLHPIWEDCDFQVMESP
uniref:uncharacterized protein LOC101307183 isoform X2 n=1 Tax=Fragaria vesca subsp. vesca TaxID=101020 RepID=UPI0005C8F2BF|nr:PREDICTED: uncharacterized protein LOC101307183 isoform X2 [Fragaria vesca subsp. vesca]